MKNRVCGLTLLELLITVILVGLIVLAFTSIQRFSLHHVIASERRAKLQNEGFLVLEHMVKRLDVATGDITDPSVRIYATVPIGIGIRIENTTSPTPGNYNDDRLVAYRRNADNIEYCNGTVLWPADLNTCTYSWEVLTQKAINNPEGFNNTLINNNTTVNIKLILRHVPGLPVTEDNPEVNLTTTVNLGSTSGN